MFFETQHTQICLLHFILLHASFVEASFSDAFLKYIRRALQVIAHLYSKHIVYNLEGYLTVGYTRLYLSYLFSYFSVTFICY